MANQCHRAWQTTSPLGDARQDSRVLLVRTITYLLNAGDAARSLALELHERWRRVLGPDHPDTLTAAASLTATLIYLGKDEQAQVVGEDALRRARRVLGPDHPLTLRLAGLRVTLITLGPGALTFGPESQDAEQLDALGEDTRQRSLRTLGPDHPITLLLSANMALGRAQALALEGDAASARAECEDALRCSRDSLGPDHLATLGLATILTLILVLQGFDRAGTHPGRGHCDAVPPPAGRRPFHHSERVRSAGVRERSKR